MSFMLKMPSCLDEPSVCRELAELSGDFGVNQCYVPSKAGVLPEILSD